MKRFFSNGFLRLVIITIMIFSFAGCQENEPGSDFPKEVDVKYQISGLQLNGGEMGTFGIMDPGTETWNIQAGISEDDLSTRFGFNSNGERSFTKTVSVSTPLGIQITDFTTLNTPCTIRIYVDGKLVAEDETRVTGENIDRLYVQHVFGANN